MRCSDVPGLGVGTGLSISLSAVDEGSGWKRLRIVLGRDSMILGYKAEVPVGKCAMFDYGGNVLGTTYL